jgi:histidyl-tRNA synthetase
VRSQDGRAELAGKPTKKDAMTKIAAPRGTADLYPPESARWQALDSRIHQIARRFGYGEIRTPMFEATELFVRGVGETTDIVEKEMYTFLDKGGRSLTLRPEWTAPVVRAMLEHNLFALGPQRLYYIGPFFRYERPQAGRYRQANQFGVECFGFAEAEADVEVIQIAHELLAAYRLPGVMLHLNSIGDACCRPRYRQALLDYFRPLAAGLSPDSQRRLERNPLRILDSKSSEDQALVAGAPTFLEMLCEACSAHFARVRALLDAVGIPYRVQPRLVRGFDYYTRTVFEFISDALGAQSTVCGGGRYDDLVRSLGGPATPAVGFGLGIERFLMVLEKSGVEAAPQPDGIALIALGAQARDRIVPLVAALRRASGGVPILADYHEGKIGAHFKRAERARARAALILGDDELAQNQIVVRDLVARTQERLPLDERLAESVLRWYAQLPAAAAPIPEAV